MRALLVCALALASSATFADFTGRVVKIVDGDTLSVLVNKNQIRVRLYGIDAPDRRQAFYVRSRQSLAQLCADKQAHVEERGKGSLGPHHRPGQLLRHRRQQRAAAPGLEMKRPRRAE